MAIDEFQFERIAVNLSGSSQRKTLHDRPHIVASASLIVPGVLNGSRGPLYYPIEEIKKNPTAWNNMPIILNHPTINGVPVSARTPEILNKSFGVVLNAKADDKLTAEAWFDIEKTRQVAPEILNMLEINQSFELSTGLSGDEDTTEGTHNGDSYRAVYRNYRPDHLAVFTDKVGACSNDDGCGINVNLGSITGLLIGTTGETDGHTHEVEIVGGDGHGIAAEANGHVHKIINFKVIDADGHKHSLIQIRLKEKTSINNPGHLDKTKVKNQETKMKNKLIESLIANCDCWTEEDKETLNGFDEEKLKALNCVVTKSKENEEKLKGQETLVNATQDGFSTEESTYVFNEKKELVETKKDKTDDKTVTNEKQEIKLEDLPADIQNDLNHYRSLRERDKNQIIEYLVENIKCDDEKKLLVENLQLKSNEDLELMTRLLPEKKQVDVPVASYFGSHTPASVSNEIQKPIPLGQPQYEFSLGKS